MKNLPGWGIGRAAPSLPIPLPTHLDAHQESWARRRGNDHKRSQMSTNEQKETREMRKGRGENYTPPGVSDIPPRGIWGGWCGGECEASTAGYAWGSGIKKLVVSNPPRAQIKTNTPPGGILLIMCFLYSSINIVLQYNYCTIV